MAGQVLRHWPQAEQVQEAQAGHDDDGAEQEPAEERRAGWQGPGSGQAAALVTFQNRVLTARPPMASPLLATQEAHTQAAE